MRSRLIYFAVVVCAVLIIQIVRAIAAAPEDAWQIVWQTAMALFAVAIGFGALFVAVSVGSAKDTERLENLRKEFEGAEVFNAHVEFFGSVRASPIGGESMTVVVEPARLQFWEGGRPPMHAQTVEATDLSEVTIVRTTRSQPHHVLLSLRGGDERIGITIDGPLGGLLPPGRVEVLAIHDSFAAYGT